MVYAYNGRLFHLKRGGEFPGGLVVRIPGFHCRGPGSIPGRGIEIPHKPCGEAKKKKGRKFCHMLQDG